MSGKRGSNSRPSAWEADALPTELLPQSVCKDTHIFSCSYNIFVKKFYLRLFLHIKNKNMTLKIGKLPISTTSLFYCVYKKFYYKFPLILHYNPFRASSASALAFSPVNFLTLPSLSATIITGTSFFDTPNSSAIKGLSSNLA